jgi:hypothetical protein
LLPQKTNRKKPVTKAELFAALAALPNDAKVLIEPRPAGTDLTPNDGDLFDIGHAMVVGEGAFGVISPEIVYLPKEKPCPTT